MSADPKGYYARLAVAPGATAEEVVAAFRRRARILHPDVPGTGDAAAFVALKAAYDVLADPVRRAEYDRSAPSPARPLRTAPAAIRMPPLVRRRGGRFGFVLSLALLGVAAVTAVLALVQLASPTSEPGLPSPTPAAARPAANQPVRVQLAGPATHYVTPGPGPAILWLPDATGERLMPAARLAPFTSVHAVALLADRGLIVVALRGGKLGFVDATRLRPGDAAAARRAFCADQAGPPPGNAELLARRGSGGDAKLLIRNHGEQPLVVKLRDLGGRAQAMVFVAPRMTVQVIGLPAGPWRADVAVGELWSRACARFAAGMRAQRLTGTLRSGGELSWPLAPSTDAAAEEIPDQAFARN